MRTRLPIVAASLLLALAAGCGRKGAEAGRALTARGTAAPAAPAFDPSRPAAALALDADQAARGLGSFEWTAGVEWTVSRQGSQDRVHAVERHRLVQAADGAFRVESEIDPGLGAGSQTGREVIWAGNLTYARGRWAPWRERPTDHGRDARRYRADGFNAPRDLAALFGPRLAIAEAGEERWLGRAARRYTLALAGEAPEAAPPAESRTFAQGGPDAETKARLAFLDGAQPVAAKGELLLDAETGVPLRVALDAAFGVKADPLARVQVALRAQVKALGADVPSVAPPAGALPDERKPSGPSDALERAGLKKKAEGERGGEPGDDEQP